MTDTHTLPACRTVLPADAWSGAADQCVLNYDDRFLRRRKLRTAGGVDFVIDLARTTSLNAGDALQLGDGRLVEIVAAPETLMEVTGPDLVRLAWHIGNRHTPCQVAAHRLLIQRDHVLRDMLIKLGASLRDVVEPFTPEGGAYGHGRTHGHSHGHTHGHEH